MIAACLACCTVTASLPLHVPSLQTSAALVAEQERSQRLQAALEAHGLLDLLADELQGSSARQQQRQQRLDQEVEDADRQEQQEQEDEEQEEQEMGSAEELNGPASPVAGSSGHARPGTSSSPQRPGTAGFRQAGEAGCSSAAGPSVLPARFRRPQSAAAARVLADGGAPAPAAPARPVTVHIPRQHGPSAEGAAPSSPTCAAGADGPFARPAAPEPPASPTASIASDSHRRAAEAAADDAHDSHGHPGGAAHAAAATQPMSRTHSLHLHLPGADASTNSIHGWSNAAPAAIIPRSSSNCSGGSRASAAGRPMTASRGNSGRSVLAGPGSSRGSMAGAGGSQSILAVSSASGSVRPASAVGGRPAGGPQVHGRPSSSG